ncbi:Hypothetical predicted protein [Cloeon dipterum]|uniref:FZ domain-containing protein n=1 Tax=Cloeon dipterum TaxID=197152 RepID=A0A8S1CBQ2_9INSE|nr:Hypothetical predicted protein [Cloeon dipterum]
MDILSPPALPPLPPPQITRQQQQQIHQNIESLNRRPPPVPPRVPPPPPLRTQDSTVSSCDSYSQNSSPSYKSMEAPLLPPTPVARKPPKQVDGGKEISGTVALLGAAKVAGLTADMAGNAIINGSATPASLQAVVKITGSNLSLHHRILRDMRRPSARHCMSKDSIRFRIIQLVINVVVLIAIGIALAIYLRSQQKEYPPQIRYINRTVTTTIAIIPKDDNPNPGQCLPVVAPLCVKHKVPYNYTSFPNYFNQVSQREATLELEVYDALVDVRCYELAALFLCTLFVPKCRSDGLTVPPCKTLCEETWKRCKFFVDVFALKFPNELSKCNLLPHSNDPEVCVGKKEVMDGIAKSKKPDCREGFQCDRNRCIPMEWRCDGHIDCEDQTDELKCKGCPEGMIHCGRKKCIKNIHMCDGISDCPWGQDERNCLRLSERMGDEARGMLEVYHPQRAAWQQACVTRWDQAISPPQVCRLLGYSEVNHSKPLMVLEQAKVSKFPFRQQIPPLPVTGLGWTSHEEPRTAGSLMLQSQLLQDVRSCPGNNFPTVELSCRDFACGRRRLAERPSNSRNSKRIVGGTESSPGDWPFLAALLGGPEHIFYCAGVLISDQWVLSASHCVGNQSDPSGWTIQLGVTRRHSHSVFSQKVRVRRVVPHPYHNKGTTHDNDVALFQLSNRVTFHEHLLPVCLPRENHRLEPDTRCTVIGWGKREDNDVDYEPVINEVSVPVVGRRVCNSWLEENNVNVTETMICAGFEQGGRDACQGDSGGPLLCRDKERDGAWFVGGIVSWGIKCAHPRLPGVYAYVQHFVPWIKEQMALYSD